MSQFSDFWKVHYEAMKIEKKPMGGLKSFRAFQDERKPIHHCDNCGCDRYNPCGCSRKDAKP